jgi:hypothetical protein
MSPHLHLGGENRALMFINCKGIKGVCVCVCVCVIFVVFLVNKLQKEILLLVH